MITIAIGLMLTTLIAYVFEKRYWDNMIGGCLAGIVLFTSIIIGLFVPIEGYNEPVISGETILLPVSDEKEDIYVSVKGNGKYAYRYEEDVWGVKMYNLREIQGNVTLEVDVTYTTPTLQERKITPKQGWFTFALFGEKTEYVFCVPPGAIFVEPGN